MSPRYCVMVEGAKVQFDRKPTPAMLTSAAESMRAVREALAPLTDEQLALQAAGRERIAARNARLRGES